MNNERTPNRSGEMRSERERTNEQDVNREMRRTGEERGGTQTQRRSEIGEIADDETDDLGEVGPGQ